MRYKYQAIDSKRQEVSGMATAETEREVIRQLQQRGLIALALTPIDAPLHSANTASKAKPSDVLVVLHELTTLLESDVSLIEAIEALAHSSHHSFVTHAFANIATQLRHGIAFSAALRTSPLQLPWYVTQLVEAGELTGKVAIALRDGVKQMEYETQVKNEMRNAMIYPAILIISGIVAILMIFTVVVPRFAGILKTRNVDIPVLAQVVLNTGMFLNTHIELILSVVIAAIVILVYLFSQPTVRARFRDAMAKLPIIGTWIIEAETARWAAMMSTLLENRVSLLRALELASQGVKLPSLNASLIQVSKAVRAGSPLSQALQDNEALTSTGHNLIRAGERAGKLPQMLHSLAKLLEESGRMRMKRFLLLIEPAAILIIGSVIGIVITGVILAITSVNEVKF